MQNPTIRERRCPGGEEDEVTEQRQRKNEDRSRHWIDLDDNVLDGYILFDDRCVGPGLEEQAGEEIPYPTSVEDVEGDNDEDGDADSHRGNYESCSYEHLRGFSARRLLRELEPETMYPLANSHGNAYRDPSSHNKYTELYVDVSGRCQLDIPRDEGVIYTMANSHGDYSGQSHESRDRSVTETGEQDCLLWDTRINTNYEIANSHSNYRVFYDSQTERQQIVEAPTWPSESWRNRILSEVYSKNEQDSTDDQTKDTEKSAPTDTFKTETKCSSEPDADSSCDIEQCLVHIEESLLNIGQNLLHVQDLDIPELRNLLYKSPSVERSLYEVQGLLYADGVVPAMERQKSLSLDSDEDEEDDEEDEEEDSWPTRNRSIKDNDDEDGDAAAGPFGASNEESSDTTNQDENNPLRSVDDSTCGDWTGNTGLRTGPPSSNFNIDPEKPINFIPNSLSKTPPRRIVLDETKENIRICPSGPEESSTVVDYNLNSTCAEKKIFFRDKCHSRTNSLDENSTFQNSELGGKHGNGKTSLQNLALAQTCEKNCLNDCAKAKSEGTLQTHYEKFHLSSGDRSGSNEERLMAVEAKAEDFRRKIESIVSHRCLSNLEMEKSPIKSKQTVSTNEKNSEKDRDGSGGKEIGCEKRKRKKESSRTQSASENALVPTKLISLSLSLLLAALLQAVRCLTDLVEDAFRSVSYDRGGLLQ